MALQIHLHMETDFWIWNVCFYKWKHILCKKEKNTFAKLKELKILLQILHTVKWIYVYLSGKNCYWLKKNVINGKRILNKREQIVGRKATGHNQRNFAFRTCFTICSSKPDPVSTMQKTGWTDYFFFLVWSSVEKGFTHGCDR